MSVTGSSAWAAPRVVRVVGIQDGISDSQADYFRRTIAELNDLTEDRIFVTRPIPAASSLDLNAYQGLDFAIVSPRVFALLERYNGFIPMASLSVDIPDCEPGAELRPVVSALVFATPDADEDGLAKPHLSDIAGETVTVVKGDEVDTTFLLQNELSSRRLAPVKVRVASDGGTPSEIIRRAVERGDKLFAVSTDLLRETSSDLFSGFVKVDMRVDDDGGVRESYKFLIESEGWRVKTYPSAEAFLEEDDPTVPGCGVFDVRMTGITGMELHQKLIELANRLPVIFVSAHGDIEMAVKAMRRGAVDFLTKPVVDEKLLSSIDRAVARSCEEAAEAETVRELAGLWQALSPRECQVAQLAAEGLTTKAVSDVLGIAERTAQVHVAHVCSKLGVENAVGVAQIIARLRARGVLQ